MAIWRLIIEKAGRVPRIIRKIIYVFNSETDDTRL